MSGSGKEHDRESVNGEAGTSVLEVARRQFGKFVTLFGSAAAVATFLIFAGFLSEFALYRFAGLPRLSFNLTSLIESGAEVVIETFALAAGSWPRLILLVAAFLAAILAWALRAMSTAG